jgi:hypothetical protein
VGKSVSPRIVPRATLLVALALGFFSFCIHFALARKLNADGAIARINLFFDCDTGWYLDGFAFGTGGMGSYGGRGIVHPNVANLVHPPVSLLSRAVGVFAGERAESKARHALALAVVPLAAAVATTFLFLCLRVAGLRSGAALLGVALSLVSFSGLLFGVLPESFGLTGAALAFVFFLVSLAARTGKVATVPWLVAGTLLLSITVTNLVPFAIVLSFVVYLQGRRPREVLEYSGKMVLGSIALTAVLFVVLTLAHGAFGELRLGGGQLEDLHPPGLEAAWNFPRALIATLVPPQPSALLSSEARGPGGARGDSVVRFTFRDDLNQIKEDDKSVTSTLPAEPNPLLVTIGSVLLLFSVALALYGLPRLAVAPRTLLLAALLLIGFNWMFHSIFGKELFLYSQHWQVALVVVISTALADSSRVGVVARCVVLLLTLVAAIRSALLFHLLLSMT